LFAIGPLIAAVAPGGFLVFLCLAFKKRARDIVEQKLETNAKPVLVTLHEVRAELVFLGSERIESAVEPVVIDLLPRHAEDVFKGGALIPVFGDPQFRGLPAKAGHREDGGDSGPGHVLFAPLDQSGQKLLQTQPLPEGQGQKAFAKIAHPLHPQVFDIGQLPAPCTLTRCGEVSLRAPLEEFGLPGAPRSRQQALEILPSGIGCRSFSVELPQRGHHPLPRTGGRPHRFAQRPVLVADLIDSLAVTAQKHGRHIRPPVTLTQPPVLHYIGQRRVPNPVDTRSRTVPPGKQISGPA